MKYGARCAHLISQIEARLDVLNLEVPHSTMASTKKVRMENAAAPVLGIFHCRMPGIIKSLED
jgi:uncharacterized protein with PhoU and TrkA domain